jgi:hypothetical protein
MKIELNIDAANIGDTVVDMFKNLTPEKRDELAREVINRWFDMPYGAEKEMHERSGVLKMQAMSEHKNKSDSECRKSWEFDKIAGEFKDTRALFLKETVELVSKGVIQVVAERLKNDPEIQKMVDAVTADVKVNFPKYVHDAMIAWFCGNMNSMAQGMSSALFQSGNTQQQLNDLTKRLEGRY